METAQVREPWRWYSYVAVAYLLLALFGFISARVRDTGTVAMGVDSVPDTSSRTDIVTEVRPDGAGSRAGIKVGDRILSITDKHGWTARFGDDETSAAQVFTARPGDRFTLHLQRDGALVDVDVTLGRRRDLPDPYRTATSAASVTLAIFYLFVGGSLILLRPADLRGVLLGCFLISLVGSAFPTPDVPPLLREVLLVTQAMRVFLAYTCIAHFALIFPEPLPFFSRRRRAFLLAYLLVLPMMVDAFRFLIGISLGQATWLDPKGPLRFLNYYSVGYAVAYVLAAVVLLFFQYRLARLEDSRRRLRLMLLGFCASFGVLMVLSLVLYFALDEKTLDRVVTSTLGRAFFLLVLSIFPLSVAYAVLKHRMFGVRVIIRAGIRYALARQVLVALMALPLLAIAYQIGRQGFGQIASARSLRLIPLVGALAAVGVLRVRILNGLDRRFFREAYDARQVLLALADRLRVANAREVLVSTFREEIGRALHPDRVQVFLREDDSSYRSDDGPERPTPGLVEILRREPRALQVGSALRRDMARITGEDLEFILRQEAEVLVPLRDREETLEGILLLGPKRSGEPFGREDLDLVRAAGNQLAASIENLRLEGEIRRRRETEERLRREIELAREVQARLLPDRPPHVPGLDIAGTCKPARFVGGDYFDYLPMGAGRLGVAIADVSGKGLAAALVMSNLQAGLRTALGAGVGVAESLRSVNTLLCELTADNRFASFFFGLFDRGSGRLHYVNAGHNSPLLIRKDGSAPVLLLGTAPVLGVLDTWHSLEREIEVRPGDVLVAYTDGLSEANNPQEQEFGEARILLAAQEAILEGASAEEIIPRILDAVERFAEGVPYEDDLTLVVIRILRQNA